MFRDHVQWKMFLERIKSLDAPVVNVKRLTLKSEDFLGFPALIKPRKIFLN
jgi:hypothetical protein